MSIANKINQINVYCAGPLNQSFEFDLFLKNILKILTYLVGIVILLMLIWMAGLIWATNVHIIININML
jgi:hypothetical protein